MLHREATGRMDGTDWSRRRQYDDGSDLSLRRQYEDGSGLSLRRQGQDRSDLSLWRPNTDGSDLSVRQQGQDRSDWPGSPLTYTGRDKLADKQTDDHAHGYWVKFENCNIL